MDNEQRIIVEFVLKGISPNSPKHGEHLIKTYLKQKGVVNDGVIPNEFYIFARPKEWK